jgi:hypothetical protein
MEVDRSNRATNTSQFSKTAIHSFAHGNFLRMSEISTLVGFMIDPRRENTARVEVEHAFGTGAAAPSQKPSQSSRI